MGGGHSSIPPEEFVKLRIEYEQKKTEGLTDEQIFNHMKDLVEKILSPPVASEPIDNITTNDIKHADIANP